MSASNLHNIVLTGFMGTGKSSVGRRLARRLAWPFVDLDTLLEERAGRSIRQIFETEGEAHFRALESDLCRETAAWPHHVIATGGGALVNSANLAYYQGQSLLICLDCEPEVLWQRLARSTNRPLLDSPDRKTRILSLLDQRQAAYARIEHHIDTTHLGVGQVAQAALNLWQATQTDSAHR
jgi:shikimate kinase